MARECKPAHSANTTGSETLSRALEIALVHAIKDHHMVYCKSKRRFHVLGNREHFPQIILKQSYICEYTACIHHDTCSAVALKEGLKEDLLEFYRAWGRARSLAKALTAFS